MRGLTTSRLARLALSLEQAKGGVQITEQLNIVGKRSGEGFVAHKATLVNALSRTLADRLVIMDYTIGRKGLLGYIKALSGSNVVKIVPASANGNASEAQVADKRLKVVCGAITGYLEDNAWIGDKTPYAMAEVRVSPNNVVKPNVGSLELAEALNRVLPFTTGDDARPVLQCVLVKAGEGKLQFVAADGFRLAIQALDYDDGEGQVLINRDELKGIANALRRAKRVKIGFTKSDETLEGMTLVIDTELIRYSWRGSEGTFPDYERLIPTDCTTMAHLDSIQAVKAIASFKAIADNPKSYAIDLTIGDGKVVMANPDDKADTFIPADTEGQGYIRVDGKYLADVLRACGGMVDFSLTNAYSPMLFSTDGYKVVVMPMMGAKAEEQAKQDKEVKAAQAEPSGEAAAVAEAENIIKAKPKRSRKREKVAVA
jgi:hypothetical protein